MAHLQADYGKSVCSNLSKLPSRPNLPTTTTTNNNHLPLKCWVKCCPNQQSGEQLVRAAEQLATQRRLKESAEKELQQMKEAAEEAAAAQEAAAEEAAARQQKKPAGATELYAAYLVDTHRRNSGPKPAAPKQAAQSRFCRFVPTCQASPPVESVGEVSNLTLAESKVWMGCRRLRWRWRLQPVVMKSTSTLRLVCKL